MYTKLVVHVAQRAKTLSMTCKNLQWRSKLDFLHLQDFRFREKYDLIIQNLEPLSVQYAWKMESKCSYVKKGKKNAAYIDWKNYTVRRNLHVSRINLYFALFAVHLQSSSNLSLKILKRKRKKEVWFTKLEWISCVVLNI